MMSVIDLGFRFNGESAHLDCEAFCYMYMHVDCITLLSYLKVKVTYVSLKVFGE